jgi:hypothetical protein
MCGIAGIHVKEAFMGRFPLDRMADALLLGIEHRGRDATGYVAVNDNNEIRFQKAPVDATEFITKKKTIPNDARTVLLHTRYATQGEPTIPANNHPVLYNSCFTVHNGHISNDDEIFNELGLPRQAQVDSEAISALFAYHGFASNEDIKTSLEALRGGFAIASVDPEQKPGRLVLAKGPNSPLFVLNHKKAFVWASSEKVIMDAWGAVLGTPPKKRANTYQGDFDGHCGIWQGKAWVIDGDEFEVMDFKSSSFYSSSSSNSRSYLDDTTEDDWYYPNACDSSVAYERWMDEKDDDKNTAPGWNRQPGWEKDPTDGWVYRGPRYGNGRGTIMGDHIKNWTCTPNYKNCEHPCTGGCNSFTNCTCIEGHPNHPGKDLAIVRYIHGGNQVAVNRSTGEVVEGSAEETYQCDGCDAFVERNEIATLILEEDHFDLCAPCWEAEGQGPFPGKQTDREKKLRSDIWKRAIAETAWELGCTTDYVVWILLECPDEELRKDSDLKRYYEQTANEFENAKAIAHDLLTGVYQGG